MQQFNLFPTQPVQEWAPEGQAIVQLSENQFREKFPQVDFNTFFALPLKVLWDFSNFNKIWKFIDNPLKNKSNLFHPGWPFDVLTVGRVAQHCQLQSGQCRRCSSTTTTSTASSTTTTTTTRFRLEIADGSDVDNGRRFFRIVSTG